MYSNVTSITQVRTAARRRARCSGAEKRSGLGPHVGRMWHVGNLGLYFVFLIPPLIIGFWLQHRLKTDSCVADAGGGRERDVGGAGRARDPRPQRPLGRPRQSGSRRPALRPLRPAAPHRQPLARRSTTGTSVASAAIAAHEVGHAIQHEKAYGPFKVRSAMFPAVAFASNAWFILLMIGVFAQISGLAELAIILFAVVVLFQLVTLPVEFDASKRAQAAAARARPRQRGRGGRASARCSAPPR